MHKTPGDILILLLLLLLGTKHLSLNLIHDDVASMSQQW
jgi:hypothetical protein